MSDRYAVIGNPVAHSKSPWIHAAFARATGQDIQYGQIEAPLDGFARTVDAFRASGGRGLNVTLPFKPQAFSYCPEASERARAAGAVNTLVFGNRVYGDNTDGVGLVRDLTGNLRFALGGKSVLLMGAGGAAQAVLQALIDSGIGRLVVANRTEAKALELAGRAKGVTGGVTGCGYPALAGQAFDLIVNATSGGLEGESPALPEGAFIRGALGYDMVYGRETPFLIAARRAGARASDGLGMLVEQAAESFFLWRGVRPDTAPVLEALRVAARAF